MEFRESERANCAVRDRGELEWKVRSGVVKKYMEGDPAPGLDQNLRLAVLAVGLCAVLEPSDVLFIYIVDNDAATGVLEAKGWAIVVGRL